METNTEKIKEEIKVVLEKAVNNLEDDYILQALEEKIDKVNKIDEIYSTRLKELIEENKLNDKLKDDIKMVETKISLKNNIN